MRGRDVLKDLTEEQNPAKKLAKPIQTRPAGSVRALKSELDKIADEAASAKELKESIAREGRIIELNPSLIDAANITDRIPVDNDDEFEVLKKAISEAGQQVPILVRPNPHDETRYQAAYGHRRLRVAKELGILVKAIVHDLTDQQMITAQGQENGPRLDLSFIERSLYASRLLEHGYDRDLVCNALGVDKPEVSRLLQVAESIHLDLIMVIGPARKIGRPRWIALAKALGNSNLSKDVQDLISQPEFEAVTDSNLRFEKLFKLGSGKKKTKASIPKTMLLDKSEGKLGWMQKTSKGITFAIEDRKLSEFLAEKMPELLSEYEQKSALKK